MAGYKPHRPFFQKEIQRALQRRKNFNRNNFDNGVKTTQIRDDVTITSSQRKKANTKTTKPLEQAKVKEGVSHAQKATLTDQKSREPTATKHPITTEHPME